MCIYKPRLQDRIKGSILIKSMRRSLCLLVLLAAPAALITPCAGWVSSPSSFALHGCAVETTSSSASSRGLVSTTMGLARREALAAGLGVSVLTLMPTGAAADMTLNSFKRSYFRWVPRIEAGRDFFVLELGTQIDNQEWAEVSSLPCTPCTAPTCLHLSFFENFVCFLSLCLGRIRFLFVCRIKPMPLSFSLKKSESCAL